MFSVLLTKVGLEEKENALTHTVHTISKFSNYPTSHIALVSPTPKVVSRNVPNFITEAI